MSTIELSVWGHAGVRLERAGQRLGIDPGVFTDAQVLDGVAAVLVTHEHADHVVPDKLAPALAERPALEVWAPQPVADLLTAAGAPAAQVHVVAEGERFTAAGFDVQVVGRLHAVIHPSIPVIPNAAYLVEGAVLHPGDAFPALPDGLEAEVLALPVSAPWMKIAEAVDYAASIAPRTVIPIHDAILSDQGKALMDRIASSLLPQGGYRRLAVGEAASL